MSKFFNVTVKPLIPASKQHAGNIANTHVLFDWTSFDIPRGAAKLIGVTALIRGKDGADYTPPDFEIFYARGNAKGTFDATTRTTHGDPTTLGEVGAAVDTPGWFNNIQGKTYVDSNVASNDGDLIYMNVVGAVLNSGGASASGNAEYGNVVLQGIPSSGVNVGYDRLYVGGVSKGNYNWESGMTVDGTPAITQKNLDVEDVFASIVLAPGDVVHDEDDRLMGTVDEVTDNTNVLMVDNLSNAGVNDKKLYNIHPITLVLSFER